MFHAVGTIDGERSLLAKFHLMQSAEDYVAGLYLYDAEAPGEFEKDGPLYDAYDELLIIELKENGTEQVYVPAENENHDWVKIEDRDEY